jgi:coenzyme F420-dependent glucose-6-phosphate dehydrogenase
MRWGYTCSSEEFPASQLVELAVAAEQAGFEFVTVSDHFHPWTQTQGHSPFAFTTIGGIAVRTESVRIGTGVTCPTIRYHPAIVAHAAATCAEMSGGRFFLGVGSGEALNEHIIGERWPAIEVRLEMLAEAVSVIRQLWTGETTDHHGDYYTVENARLFDPPATPPEIIWAAGGERSAALAAEHGDGLWSTSPSKETVDAYRSAGGQGEVIGQLTVCWNEDEAKAKEIALRQWPNAGLGGQLSQELPTWSEFEAAAELVTPDKIASEIVCGNDVQHVVDAAREYADAGFTMLHLHQVGPDQQGFLSWWDGELSEALSSL